MLLLQYHALSTIMACGQWNALRHGHFAYYSTTALTAMLAAVGFARVTAWQFDLYGGTVLLAATTGRDGPGQPTTRSDRSSLTTLGLVSAILAPSPSLQRDVRAHAGPCTTGWLRERAAGQQVLGYGAASRAVALLCQAHVDHRSCLR